MTLIRSVCNTCFQAYVLRISDSEKSLLSEILDASGESCPCPRNCGGSIPLQNSQEFTDMHAILREPLSITGTELYQAVNGLPLPDEVVKDLEVVKHLSRPENVKYITLSEHDGQVYVSDISLNDGMKLHLTAGPRGALLFKITKQDRESK